MIQIFVVAVPGFVIREDFPHYLLRITLLLKTVHAFPILDLTYMQDINN